MRDRLLGNGGRSRWSPSGADGGGIESRQLAQRKRTVEHRHAVDSAAENAVAGSSQRVRTDHRDSIKSLIGVVIRFNRLEEGVGADDVNSGIRRSQYQRHKRPLVRWRGHARIPIVSGRVVIPSVAQRVKAIRAGSPIIQAGDGSSRAAKDDAGVRGLVPVGIDPGGDRDRVGVEVEGGRGDGGKQIIGGRRQRSIGAVKTGETVCGGRAEDAVKAVLRVNTVGCGVRACGVKGGRVCGGVGAFVEFVEGDGPTGQDRASVGAAKCGEGNFDDSALVRGDRFGVMVHVRAEVAF